MRTLWLAQSTSAARRGMLLLLVLSMLTLFVLMGSLAIVIATRSRESARAFAAANSGSTPVIAKSMTDEALLTLIRGSKDSVVSALIGNDSLLKDMYGTQGKGRFVDEPYDAFDDLNAFLTQVTLDTNGRVSGVPRPAFAARDTPCTVDNDGDGVLDGIWIPQSSTPTGPGILPPLLLSDGNTLTFRLSYLVLDLDSRINVNAHGKRSDAPASQPGEIGPADVDASALFTPPVWALLMERAGATLLTGSVAPSAQWRDKPPIGSAVDGRFGALKDGTGNAVADTYTLRLDLEAQRPATLTNASGQNPFTLGELERVLRQFDADASTLPPRLAGILHDRAERLRMQITTDSWETPVGRTNIAWDAQNSGKTGEQAFFNELCQKIAARLYPKWNSPPSDPDQAIHLSKLRDAEQWVANIIEFRDKDNASASLNRITGGSVTGVEPSDLPFAIPSGPVAWNSGLFTSYAQVLSVPQGDKSQIMAKKQKQPVPDPIVSLAKDEPLLLELLMVPTLFTSTYWETYTPPPLKPSDPPNKERVPTREPGRINVNTCDKKVWDSLVGEPRDNPFDDNPNVPARNIGHLLTHPSLVFNNNLPGDVTQITDVNQALASRLANIATVRSHVFAVWITLESKRSDNPDQPTYHRLFAIVDRSVPVNFTAESEGQTTDEVRNTIRLQRFLN